MLCCNTTEICISGRCQFESPLEVDDGKYNLDLKKSQQEETLEENPDRRINMQPYISTRILNALCVLPSGCKFPFMYLTLMN